MTNKHLIEYAQLEHVHLFRFAGDIRYSEVAKLHQFVEALKDTKQVYVLDLYNAVHLDSTAIGVLALMAKQQRSVTSKKPIIHLTDNTVKEALLGVCFDLIFDFSESLIEYSNKEWVNLNDDKARDLEELKETIRSAHIWLSEIDEKNAFLFHSVNQMLAK